MRRNFSGLGFNVLLVFLFLASAAIFDVKFGALHITGAAFRVVLAMVRVEPRFALALQTKIGKALLGFTVMHGLAVPFSVWRTGSKNIFYGGLDSGFVAFLAEARAGGELSAVAEGAPDVVGRSFRLRCDRQRLRRFK